MKVLVLFSGTKSIEKVYPSTDDIRGLDFDNKFKPFYNVDILTWNYKKVFKNWIPDYIHGSPVCKEFSNIKHGFNRDLGLGKLLLLKTLEIIEYVKRINPNLKFTIENPKGLMRKLDVMKKYNMITTSYCKYDFPYKKETDFWFGGFELKLRCKCRNTHNVLDWCDSKKEFGIHEVRLGVGRNSKTHHLGENQIPDGEYFRELRKIPKYKGFTSTYFRYRIPEQLCLEMMNCVKG